MRIIYKHFPKSLPVCVMFYGVEIEEKKSIIIVINIK